MPQNLLVLRGGMDLTAETSVAAVSTSVEAQPVGSALADTLVKPAAMDDRAKARMQGYEGDPCGECGNFTLVRNGTCLKCNTCGGTSGCS